MSDGLSGEVALRGPPGRLELHFLKSRMIGARRNKVGRGGFLIRLPTGYVWEEEQTRLDPDERIRDAMRSPLAG